MNIFTTYFVVKRIPGSTFLGDSTLRFRAARQQEYVDCLVRNAQHPQVRSITLLVEGADGYAHFRDTFLQRPPRGAEGVEPLCEVPTSFTAAHLSKIVPILFAPAPGQRPMPLYSDLFHKANLFHSDGGLAMVCNADVHLSATQFNVCEVQKLFQQAELPGSQPARAGGQHHGRGELLAAPLALALTRHEADAPHSPAVAPLIHDYRGSHDAFVFRPPVPPSLLRQVAHPQNCYQAENIVIHAFQAHRYAVVNPCLDLRLVHQHAAEVRQWLPSVDPSRYGRAAPTTLAQCMKQFTEDFTSSS